MAIPSPETIDVAAVDRIEGVLEQVPNRSAVFLIWPHRGAPLLSRTTVLRRRLGRLLKARESSSRLLNLRGVASRVEYWLTGSRLEEAALVYELARLHFPDSYLKIVKLRMPFYLKLGLANPFPRTQITSRQGGSRGVYLGPFRSRAAAEQFESQSLDLFQIRRCQEDLEPSPEHPGCIYGEMNMCLRPCQKVVGQEEYQSEVARVVQFLSTGGRSLVESISAARDRLSQEMDFEEAARQHKLLERVQQVLKLKDELASDLEHLNGVAVTRSAGGEVNLWFILQGACLAPVAFQVGLGGEKSSSLDHELRVLTATLAAPPTSLKEKQERLALFSRWFYSSWRDGEWIPFDSLERIPYRKLIRALSRVLHAEEQSAR